jgi:hypothetical protein
LVAEAPCLLKYWTYHSKPDLGLAKHMRCNLMKVGEETQFRQIPLW